MKTFNQFLESVKDVATLKRKPLAMRTAKDIAFLNAYSNKAKPPVVTVELVFDDGTKYSEKFKITKTGNGVDLEKEAREIADGHLTNMQKMYDKFPNTHGAKRPQSIGKVTIK